MKTCGAPRAEELIAQQGPHNGWGAASEEGRGVGGTLRMRDRHGKGGPGTSRSQVLEGR